MPLFDLDSHNVDLDIVKLVQDKLLQKHRCLPLYRRGKRLFLGVADPTNLHAIDEIKFQTGLGIEAVVVEDDKLQKAIDKAVEQADTADAATSATTRPASISRTSTSPAATTTWKARASPATTSKTRPSCASSTSCCSMPSAAARRTSISSPTKRCTASALRMDGILKEVAQPPVQLAMKLSARLKVMSRLDIAERRVPQDGRIKMKLSKTRAIDFRVSTCPTLFGEKIVCVFSILRRRCWASTRWATSPSSASSISSTSPSRRA